MPEKLERIGRGELNNSPVKPGHKWNNRIRLEPIWNPNKKLVYKQTDSDSAANVLNLHDKDQLEECVFTVLNADIKEKDPDISTLYDSLPAVGIPFNTALFGPEY